MSKIICDVCGTSYPETSAQCPICGCVRPADSKGVSGNTVSENKGTASYQHVKGGRFSKANVQKRNKGMQVPARNTTSSKMAKNSKKQESDTKGLVITAVVLLLAIIAVLIYISLRFFAPSVLDNPKQTLPKETQGTVSNVPEETTLPKEISCTAVSFDVEQITFDKIGAARMVYVTAEPEDTTDAVSYTSSDPSVATISDEGKITAIGNGEAIITVTCGGATATCKVTCFDESAVETTEATTEATIAEEVFMLNRSDITFSKKDESWLLYSGSIASSAITWSSDNVNIATIENGKVVAVGGGVTNVHGEYNGQKVSCVIRCNFSSNQGVAGSGGVSEDDGGNSGSVSESGYQLYNPYGNAEDVTIKVGDSFSLQLRDSAGTSVAASWAVGDSSFCSVSGSTFTGLAAGTTKVTATYDGKVYTCVVRIIE